MTVYVDDMLMQATVGRVTSRWSHLMADTDDELHEFAARLGMRRSWAQFPGTPKSHYDLTEGKRWQAIRLGAVQITWMEADRQFTQRKREAREAAHGSECEHRPVPTGSRACREPSS